MKTSYLVSGVGVLAVVGLVGWLTLGGDKNVKSEVLNDSVNNNSEIQTIPESDNLSGKDTFANLFKLGRTLECSFLFKDAAINGEGTGFFDGKQMRIDAMYTTDEGVMTSNMINDSETMYVWSNTPAGEMAIKMAAPKEGEAEYDASPSTASQQQLDPNQSVSYNCKPWSVDGSVFVPPANIKFMDMTEMMNSMPAGMKMPTN